MRKLRLGYIRLVDAAPLIAARALGAYARQGLRVELVPLRSWAEIRDRLIVGDIHAAHCLAGIPLASQAGLFGPQATLATAFTLNHHGNAITLAPALAAQVRAGEAAFAQTARERHRSGRPLVLASVFPVSKHEYELRHWIASFGLDPRTDMRLVIVPPPETARALRDGRIDGYCVGEPWNTAAIAAGWGEAVSTSAGAMLPGTEKVLAVRTDFLDRGEHGALLAALGTAGDWLGDATHAEAAVELIAPYVGRPLAELRPALLGTFRAWAPAPAPFVRFDRAVQRPDVAHAGWYLEQMQRAGRLAGDAPVATIAARTFRADLYDALLHRDRAAAGP